jgi:hypothetical protein
MLKAYAIKRAGAWSADGCGPGVALDPGGRVGTSVLLKKNL